MLTRRPLEGSPVGGWPDTRCAHPTSRAVPTGRGSRALRRGHSTVLGPDPSPPTAAGRPGRWVGSTGGPPARGPPRLAALTHAGCALRQEVTGRIPAALVAQSPGRRLQQRPRCGPDGQRLRPARPAPERTGHPMVGAVSRSRPACYGPSYQQGIAPLDDALQLPARRAPWDLQPAVARLAAEVPLQTAQELGTQLTGLALSDQTIHVVAGELRPELGVLEVSPPAAAMAAGQT